MQGYQLSWQGPQWKNKQDGKTHGVKKVLSIASYLIAWVANGELLQIITNGNMGIQAYNKPAAITWFSYNFMILSSLSVILHPHRQKVNWGTLLQQWSGKLGFRKAILICAGISYLLLLLNILMIVGLRCISVGLSNAIYQLQTPFTIALSVFLLGDKFLESEAIGIFLCFLGVCLIVAPPLSKGDEGDYQFCWSGVVATAASALIGGAYLVSWRVLEMKNISTLNKSERFLDVHMTLAAIGFCNLFIGWPILLFLDELHYETMELPYNWGILFLNGIVEYAFDASCAIAIYTTSPIIVAIVAPITIPMSMLVDQLVYGGNGIEGWGIWSGIILSILGTLVIELKPFVFRSKVKQKDEKELFII